MNKDLIAVSDILINASPAKVWAAMTEPKNIKIYLFGTEVTSDWKVGSPIYLKGEYSGKTYHDKGKVTEIQRHRKIQYTYWSTFSGTEDKKENYAIVSYIIEKVSDTQVKFTWHQQGFADEEGKCHTQDGLKSILEQIKNVAEQ